MILDSRSPRDKYDRDDFESSALSQNEPKRNNTHRRTYGWLNTVDVNKKTTRRTYVK